MSDGAFQQAGYSKEMVQYSFDLASQNYNKFTSLQRRIADSLLHRHEVPNRVLERVLDVGSGTGYLTKSLAGFANVKQLYAVDIAVSMLAQTKLNLVADQAQGYVCADAEVLSFADEVMDAIYSSVAFQWCSDLQAVFNETYRTLKPEGSLIFSTFGPSTLFELKEAWETVDNAAHVNTFVGLDDIRRSLEMAGFKNISIKSENIVKFYEAPKQLMLDLKGMGAHNMNQGRRLGLTGVQSYKAMLKSYELRRTQQGIPATFQAVYVYAEKPAKQSSPE